MPLNSPLSEYIRLKYWQIGTAFLGKEMEIFKASEEVTIWIFPTVYYDGFTKYWNFSLLFVHESDLPSKQCILIEASIPVVYMDPSVIQWWGLSSKI